ncbi:pyridoxamine 5'-phosphate oxidase family protein [Pedobacter puniceum]|uniref:Pyridoxamine 5'-phosphate oxidase Alr4036 family FMN-binding domain-containing protein n=1 Tax=Pedobacter puniceum TaxID=2666136 RepID=A0A7K0FQ40_9SPHI|nr:pyridoxamine 5'-phosphate oxidase family protein [Pedobacter puniceum]MRX47993.1 hypothetical protein [Pedobacter puniceum]
MFDQADTDLFLKIELNQIIPDILKRLDDATKSSKAAFHEGYVATIHDGIPEIRTVVLRKVLFNEEALVFHTDMRSPKVHQIKNNPQLSWLFYDAALRIQVRFKAIAEIHHQNELTQKQWEGSRLESRKCYLVEPAPSTQIQKVWEGIPNIAHQDLTAQLVSNGYHNFAVIKTKLISCDWLFLNRRGHKRAIFTKNIIANTWEGKWVQP